VNRTRVKLGYNPIKNLRRGDIGNAAHCPIAGCFPGFVEVDGWSVTIYGKTEGALRQRGYLDDEYSGFVEISSEAKDVLTPEAKLRAPKVIQEFVDRFDSGKLPELAKSA
jgi:starvation-inducible outer membrane lipoprotein